MKPNMDIRMAIGGAGLTQWQVAEAYGLSESNFSRIMRKEMSSETKTKVYDAIKKASEQYGHQQSNN